MQGQQMNNTSKVNGAVNAVTQRVSDAAHSVSDKLNGLGTQFSDARDDVVDYVQKESEIVGDYAKRAYKQTPVMYMKFERMIRRHPYYAMGIASVIGVVAMRLLTRTGSN